MCNDPRRKSGTRQITKTLFLKFTPLPPSGVFLYHMVTTQSIYQAFLTYPKVSTDSRKDVKETIFFALSGENFDGNAYAEKALESGARYAVIDKPEYAKDDRYLLVKDTLATLQEMARMHRTRNLIPVVGITGSNGKNNYQKSDHRSFSFHKKSNLHTGQFQ